VTGQFSNGTPPGAEHGAPPVPTDPDTGLAPFYLKPSPASCGFSFRTHLHCIAMADAPSSRSLAPPRLGALTEAALAPGMLVSVTW